MEEKKPFKGDLGLCSRYVVNLKRECLKIVVPHLHTFAGDPNGTGGLADQWRSTPSNTARAQSDRVQLL